jgi:hypothetical protein
VRKCGSYVSFSRLGHSETHFEPFKPEWREYHNILFPHLIDAISSKCIGVCDVTSYVTPTMSSLIGTV